MKKSLACRFAARSMQACLQGSFTLASRPINGSVSTLFVDPGVADRAPVTSCEQRLNEWKATERNVPGLVEIPTTGIRRGATMREEKKPPLRRQFVTWLLRTSVGGFVVAVIYPVVRYLIPPAQAEAAVASVTLPFGPSDLPPNSGRVFKFGSRPAIIIRTPAGELRAFTAVCTHLSCTVQYRGDLSHIWCACHNGHFSLSGVNIAGPPPRPLEAYTVRTRGNEIVVSRRA